MKTKNEILLNADVRVPYETPCVKTQNVALEYSVAAGSVQGTVTESWQTETQSQDVEW